MATGNSFTKFMLIVCGIILMTAAFSGCTDVNTKGDGDSVSAYAQTSNLDLTAPFLEIQSYLDQTDNPLKGTDINVLGSKIRDKAVLQDETPLDNGMTLFEYKWGKTRFEITGKDERTPYEIIVKYNNGKEIKAIDNHGNADLDIVTGTDKNGNEVFTYPSTADAQFTNTQLGGAPGSDIEKAVANYVADGSIIPLNHLVVDNPQTPEQVAVALLSSMDNIDTDGIEPYMKRWSAEEKQRIDPKLMENTFEQYPDITSMTIDSSEKVRKDGGGFGYRVKGNIDLDDGRTLPYKVSMNENKKVTSLFID